MGDCVNKKNVREPKEISDTIAKLRNVWKKHPNLRLGQLIGNCMNYQQLYYLEDAAFIRQIEKTYAAIDTEIETLKIQK